jgi:hypothetical protein
VANQTTADPTPLSAATVQEIQFELFRRSAVSVEYGDLVEPLLDVLRGNRHLWTGMIVDRIDVPRQGRRLGPMSMIPLRDISTNFWNADTLYVLCPSRAAADQLAALLPMERFAAMVNVIDNPDELDDALGGADDGVAILRAWWD